MFFLDNELGYRVLFDSFCAQKFHQVKSLNNDPLRRQFVKQKTILSE